MRTPSLLRSTLLISAASLGSRLLGLVRENLLASRFGGLGEGTLDAYYAAFRIPDFLFNIVILSAGSAIFVPLFARALRGGEDETNRVVSNVMNVCMAILVVMTIGCYLLLPWLSDAMTIGFTAAKRAETFSLMRLMLLSPLFFGLSSILGSYLNARRDFTSSILSPVSYNLSLIAGIVFLTPYLGVHGLAYGVVIGSILHVVVQLPALRGFHFSYRRIWQPGADYLREARRLILPRLFGIGATQLNLTVDTVVAGLLPSGSLTVLSWVQNIQYLPLSLIGISVSITAFTALSELSAADDIAAFRSTLQRNTLSILFFILPATVGFLVLRTSVVDLILNYGRFAAVGANLSVASWALCAYVLSLPLQALVPLMTRAFYALHDTRTPVYAAVMGVVVNIALSYLLAIRLQWGIAGLGVAFSSATLVNAAVLSWKLHTHDVLSLHAEGFLAKLARMIVSALVMGVFANSIAKLGTGLLSPGKQTTVLVLVLTALVGSACYYVVCYAFGLIRGYKPQL